MPSITASSGPNLGLVSVRDWGAVGDGVADDTVAFQLAINQAIARSIATPSTPGQFHRVTLAYPPAGFPGMPQVFVPEGIYRITGTLTVNLLGGWRGTGAAATIGAGAVGLSLVGLGSNSTIVVSSPVNNGSFPLFKVIGAGATQFALNALQIIWILSGDPQNGGSQFGLTGQRFKGGNVMVGGSVIDATDASITNLQVLSVTDCVVTGVPDSLILVTSPSIASIVVARNPYLQWAKLMNSMPLVSAASATVTIQGNVCHGAGDLFSGAAYPLGPCALSVVGNTHSFDFSIGNWGIDVTNCTGLVDANNWANNQPGQAIIHGAASVGGGALGVQMGTNLGVTVTATGVAGGSVAQSATAPAVATGGTIATAGLGVSRVAPAGAVTGVILAAGTYAGQSVTVVNESVAASTITFAAAGISNVADGASGVLPGLAARSFIWDSVTALWYRAA